MLLSSVASTSLALAGLAACTERNQSPRTGEKPVAPDNTEINERDREEPAVTPPDQLENEIDLRIAKEARASIVGHDQLSFTAENVKIVVREGVVTLRGPVKTAEEKRLIEERVGAVAGVIRVVNELEVAP